MDEFCVSHCYKCGKKMTLERLESRTQSSCIVYLVYTGCNAGPPVLNHLNLTTSEGSRLSFDSVWIEICGDIFCTRALEQFRFHAHIANCGECIAIPISSSALYQLRQVL